MCYFCYAQLFEITHLTNIKSTLVQHSCRNAEVVEAFCRVAASRSNTRRSIHQPSVAALHAPAEMPTALSSILRYQTLHVASCPRRAYHRERPALNPHSARCLAGAQLPATSCLGAFRPPATSSCGGSRDPGVRKPAQERTIAPSVFWSAQLDPLGRVALGPIRALCALQSSTLALPIPRSSRSKTRCTPNFCAILRGIS